MGPFAEIRNEPRLMSVSNLTESSENLADVHVAKRCPKLVTISVPRDELTIGNANNFESSKDEQRTINGFESQISTIHYDDLKTNHAAGFNATNSFSTLDVYNAQKNGLALPSPGTGSMSSGTSIISITSVSNSEPDRDPNSPGGLPLPGGGDGRKSVIDERWYTTTLQVSVPFFIAGIGTIGAGLILSDVQSWPVFIAISELFIMVPSLIGLKGNLDMCLASRLSTQANLGNMSSFREIMKMIVGNIALVQIQAIVAATLVAVFAVTASIALGSAFNWDHALLLAASSVCTATSSCFILDFVMIAVIMVTHRCKMNPDNLATPLAASIGDVVSTSVLAIIASALYVQILAGNSWVLYTILGGYICMLPIWIAIVLKNKYTRNILTSGWTPVLSALFISGLGGLILDQAVGVLEGFVIFQPIINGIGGNLVSVQASKISTMLHQTSLVGILPPHTKTFVSPWRALVKGVPYAKSARILICMAVVGHLVFVFVADYIQWGYSTLHVYFVVTFLVVAVLQVLLLLYIAHIMIHVMWRRKVDPDSSAIPYLTALGDLTGSVVLGAAFIFLKSIGHPYGDY